MELKKRNYILAWLLCSVLFWIILYLPIGWDDNFVFAEGTFLILQLGFLWGFILKFKPKYRWIYWSVFVLLVLLIIAELVLLGYVLSLGKAYRDYPY